MLGFKDLDAFVDYCRAGNRCPYATAAECWWRASHIERDKTIAEAIRRLRDARVKACPSGRALCVAFRAGYRETARKLVDLGICDPLTARDKEERNATILHSAIWGNAYKSLKEAYRLVPLLIHETDEKGDTPLDYAICCPDCRPARFLLEQGAQLNQVCPSSGCSTMLYALENSSLGRDTNGMYGPPKMARLVFAYGGRVCPLPSWIDDTGEYNKCMRILFARFRRCARAAVAVLGLSRVGCKTQGNGRDALWLIARMIWVYRVDEAWDYCDDDDIQEHFVWAPSEDDEDRYEDEKDEEEEEEYEGGESPQKRAAIE